MAEFQDRLEDVLREILRTEVFSAMWANWIRTTHVATHGDHSNWEVIWPAALVLVAATGEWDSATYAWSADTWQRVMFEEGLIG